MVFRGVKVAVFIDGCFWHGCPEHHSLPATNTGYWSEKVRRNRERDLDTDERLIESGWTVFRAWEHEDPIEVAHRVIEIVTASRMASSD
jgi:DNA mismatch endonuclease (patch repair protein)